MVTTCTQNSKNKYTELLKNGVSQKKYRVAKTRCLKGVQYNCGEIIIGELPEQSKIFEEQYAFTCHSL